MRTVNLYAKAATASYGSVVLDASDTTTLVLADTVAYSFGTGNITGTDSLTSITATTSTSTIADLTIGTVVDLNDLTSVSLTAVLGDITLSTDGDFGADADGAEGDVLSAITLSATTATIDFADGQAIYANSFDDDVDTTLTITATAATSSTINMGSVESDYGYIAMNASATGTITVDSLQALTVTIVASGAGTFTVSDVDTATATSGGDVTATFSGAGAFTLSAVDADGDVTITGSDITASGTLTVLLSDVDGDATITGGAGISTITTSNGATSGATYITLGASNGLADVINMNATEVGVIEITNFEVSYDKIETDVSALIAAATSALSIETLGDGSTNVTGSISFETITAAASIAASAAQILVLNSDFALPSMVTTAIETGGTFALTLTSGAFVATEGMLILWDDGTDSYLSIYQGDSTAATVFDSGGTLDTLVTFVGISDCTTITAASLGGSFNS